MSEAEYINEICALRARLAEVEAERDQVAYDRDCAREAGLVYRRKCADLRARLAEIEAEMVRMGRDHTVRLQVRDEEETALRARLAEVEALQLSQQRALAAVLLLVDDKRFWSASRAEAATLVRDAARGEGDQ